MWDAAALPPRCTGGRAMGGSLGPFFRNLCPIFSKTIMPGSWGHRLVLLALLLSCSCVAFALPGLAGPDTPCTELRAPGKLNQAARTAHQQPLAPPSPPPSPPQQLWPQRDGSPRRSLQEAKNKGLTRAERETIAAAVRRFTVRGRPDRHRSLSAPLLPLPPACHVHFKHAQSAPWTCR